ncbi:putative class II aldolase [uncultured delta proteobacterium]|uniref:3-oxo-tetronate 4-phosphate decarboxylase n=1 Tax=uncultured delta proteobacterium TaxID=34034 RepID=A0A212KFI3_9DELT|nr:putative class II aldolase [uncultured delta proteobacterium]
MTESRLREEMAALGASLFNRGFSSGSGGNMSAKLPDGAILATPTNASLGRLDPARLSKVAADGTLLSGDPPSKECAFHIKIYEARPECGAVVHLHSTYATGLACCRDLDVNDVLRPFTPYYVMKVAPLPLVPYCKPGSPELVAAIAAKAREAKCLLLANHGPIVTGKTLEDAVNMAEELEETAKLFFLLRGSGVKTRYLTGEEIRELAPDNKEQPAP